MALLEQILEENAKFTASLPESYLHRNDKVSKYPARQLAIYTCMDTRLVDFLEPAMGISRGEAKVIKAAGNMITGPFDEVIRSLMVAVYELGVTEIMVVGHEDCGMQHSTSESLKKRMLERGIKPEAITEIESEFSRWVDAFIIQGRMWKKQWQQLKITRFCRRILLCMDFYSAQIQAGWKLLYMVNWWLI